MIEIIRVDTAAFSIAHAGQALATQGIGSCIVVCIYDKVRKKGAMVHCMLPSAELDTNHPLRFVDTALPIALKELNAKSSNDLEAYLVGGASMFANLEDHMKLGVNNCAAAEDILTKHGIIIKGREIGGTIGRSVIFYIDTGEIQVITK